MLIMLTALNATDNKLLAMTKTNATKRNFDNLTPYTLQIVKDDYSLMLYEQNEGCYLGANIIFNRVVDCDIKTFEDKVKTPHAIYYYPMDYNESFPLKWILSCISQMKTPLVELKLPPELVLDEIYMENLAKNFGDFYVPMFIQITVDKSYDSEEFVEYFRFVSDNFREYASNCAIVWSVEGADVLNYEPFYPGDEYIDWIGLDALINLDKNCYKSNFDKMISSFYYSFQTKKPLMISKLGVSHMSTINYVYQTPLASNLIQQIYSTIITRYPRIKSVCYMDFNSINFSKTDNYSITENENVLTAYKNSTNRKGFLSEINILSTGML